VTCRDVVKDDAGRVVEVRCTYDPETRGGDAPDGRKVKGTLHWVSARHAIPAEIRRYEPLFREVEPDPGGEGGLEASLDPSSLEVLRDCHVEPSLAEAAIGDRLQLERLGYYCVDPDSRPDALVLNRTVTLRDSWARVTRGDAAAPAAAQKGQGGRRSG
jgi:glutaminyl-tRNA synthetase